MATWRVLCDLRVVGACETSFEGANGFGAFQELLGPNHPEPSIAPGRRDIDGDIGFDNSA